MAETSGFDDVVDAIRQMTIALSNQLAEVKDGVEALNSQMSDLKNAQQQQGKSSGTGGGQPQGSNPNRNQQQGNFANRMGARIKNQFERSLAIQVGRLPLDVIDAAATGFQRAGTAGSTFASASGATFEKLTNTADLIGAASASAITQRAAQGTGKITEQLAAVGIDVGDDQRARLFQLEARRSRRVQIEQEKVENLRTSAYRGVLQSEQTRFLDNALGSDSAVRDFGRGFVGDEGRTSMDEFNMAIRELTRAIKDNKPKGRF